MYTDTSGEQQSVLLGNVADLRTVKVKEVGGIPIEKLQAHYEHQRKQNGKRDTGMPSSIVGFPDDRQIELPPNAVKVYEVRKLPDTTCGLDHTGMQVCSLVRGRSPVTHIWSGHNIIQFNKAVCLFVDLLLESKWILLFSQLAPILGRISHYSITVKCASQNMFLCHMHDLDADDRDLWVAMLHATPSMYMCAVRVC